MKIAFIDHHNGLSGGQRSLSVFLNFYRMKCCKTNSNLDYIIILDSLKGEFYNWLVENGYKEKIKLIKFNTKDSRENNFSGVAKSPLKILQNITLLKTPLELSKVLKKEKVDIAYGNSFKAGFFISLCKFIHTPIKHAFRVRTALDFSSHGWIDRLIFKTADVIFSNSYYVSDTIPKKFQSKTKVVYNHLNLKQINLVHHKSQSGLKLLVIGRITKRKRQHEAVDLINLYPELKYDFTFVGDTEASSSDYLISLKNKIKECERPESFKFLNFTENIHELMFKYDAIFLPSIFEPLSRVLIESMALGCILITTNDSGNKELIKNGRNGFLYEPGNLEQLRDILINFEKMNDRKNIRNNAKATFSKYFNEKETVTKELNTLKGLIQ